MNTMQNRVTSSITTRIHWVQRTYNNREGVASSIQS